MPLRSDRPLESEEEVPMPARAATRRPPLSRERVVAAAMQVADREGVAAVTMRRLAEVLAVHPTSLYNHLPTKEAILDALADAVLADAELPVEVTDWRDWIRSLAAGLARTARRHPGAFLVLTQRPTTGPVSIGQAEVALDALIRDGFTGEQATRIVTGTSRALLGVAINECFGDASLEPSEVATADPSAYPRVTELEDVEVDNDAVWDLVVGALIAGLETARR